MARTDSQVMIAVGNRLSMTNGYRMRRRISWREAGPYDSVTMRRWTALRAWLKVAGLPV